VKLLFDENLSPDLALTLSDLFPGSTSVLRLKPKPVSDRLIWHYARENGFAIISKDNDFQQRAIRHGHPPKVIWLRCGNCTVEQVEQLIRERAQNIAAFLHQADESLLLMP